MNTNAAFYGNDTLEQAAELFFRALLPIVNQRKQTQMNTKLNNLGANRTLISKADGTEILFSYSTPVAAFVPGRGYLRTSERYSVTTSKHINQWLRDRTANEESPEFFAALL